MSLVPNEVDKLSLQYLLNTLQEDETVEFGKVRIRNESEPSVIEMRISKRPEGKKREYGYRIETLVHRKTLMLGRCDILGMALDTGLRKIRERELNKETKSTQ